MTDFRSFAETAGTMTKRNLMMFFRDRSSVLATLMGIVIILFLYIGILRSGIVGEFADYPSPGTMANAWITGGLLGIIPVTASAVAMGRLLYDRISGTFGDFRSSPADTSAITFGYILSTFVVAFVMSLIFLVFACIWAVYNGLNITASDILISVGLMVPSILSACSILFFLTFFINSKGAYNGFIMILNILIGFGTGTFIPMGIFSKSIQNVMSVIPATQSGAIFRDIFGAEAMETTFGTAGEVETMRTYLGYDLNIGSWQIDPVFSVLYLFGTAAVFFLLSVLMMRRR